MKKVIIFSLIVLLSFISSDFSCTANDPFNYGNVWNSWSDYMRDIYITGYKDGLQDKLSFSFLNMLNHNHLEEKRIFDEYLKESELVKQIQEHNRILWDFLFFDNESIRNVANDLYKDPTNSYIPYHKIITIAYRKLCGDSIDSLLQYLRKESLR